ncbi:MAG TPA: hypothetical protein VJ550_16725 [Geomonas sp.]|nr:hypothetical protein [Geomonas sp.]
MPAALPSFSLFRRVVALLEALLPGHPSSSYLQAPAAETDYPSHERLCQRDRFGAAALRVRYLPL